MLTPLKRALTLLPLLLASFSLSAIAQESLINPFGPRTYIKQTGAPITVSESFTVPTTSGTYYLTVFEGVNGSKAEVKLNGSVVLTPAEMMQGERVHRKLITVQTSNTLDVTVQGAPGSDVRVFVNGVCSQALVPLEDQNETHNLVLWEQTVSRQTPPVTENFTVNLDNLNGLFWLEVDRSGLVGGTAGEIKCNGDTVFSSFAGTTPLISEPILPGSTNTVSVKVLGNPANQITVRLKGLCADPDSGDGDTGVILAGFGGAYITPTYGSSLIVSPCDCKTIGFEYDGCIEGNLKIRSSDDEVLCFEVEKKEFSEITIESTGEPFKREVSGVSSMKLVGKRPGCVEIQWIDCVGSTQTVIRTDKVVIKDYFFTITGSCPSRNCPSTDECGPLGCLKQDGYSMLVSQGLFQPKFQALPFTLGRNGLTPDWTLRYNSRAYNCGGHFGRTPFFMDCFERLKKDSSGDYVYLEQKIREFTFSTTVSNTAVTGWTATERYEVIYEQSGEVILRRRNGTKLVFYPINKTLTEGALKRIENRFGDTLTFSYDDCGQLETVTDAYSRDWDFTYDSSLRVTKIKEETTDLLGRQVDFDYDSTHRLTKMTTTPVNTDGGIGNTFTSGKETNFTYPTWTGNYELGTNIISIKAPNEGASGAAYVTNTYGTTAATDEYDRVTDQTWGGTNASGRATGGDVDYEYALSSYKVTVTDRNGNETLYTFDSCLCHALSIKEKTNRAIRSSEGDYTTSISYNSDGEITSITWPEGNSDNFTYDTSNTNRFAHGNLLTTTRKAGTRGGDGSGSSINDIVFKYTYEPIFQQIRTISTARGNDSGYSPPVTNSDVIDIDFDLSGSGDGLTQRSRYTTLTIYDYQEASSTSISSLASAQKVVVTGTQASALSENTDINGDSLTNQEVGRPIRIQRPVTILDDGNDQSLLSDMRYNSFGLLIATIDGEGYLSEYRYGPSTDPDGTTASTSTGGYPLEVVVDNSTALRTPNYSTSRTQIKTRSERNKVGMVTTSIDARGIETTLVVNERNQVQLTTIAADTSSLNSEEPVSLTALSYQNRTFYDANDNVTKVEFENDVPSASSPIGGDTTDNPWFTTTTTYDILNNPIETTNEIQVASEDMTVLGKTLTVYRSSASNTVTTKFWYDKNEHVVLSQSPLSVSTSETNNVSSTIFDERDLTYKSSRGGIDSSFSSQVPIPASIPTGITSTNATTTTTNYDGNKNGEEFIDAEDNGATGVDTSTMVYDGFDRVVESIDAFGNESLTFYDPDSQVEKVQRFGPDGANKAAIPANMKRLAESESFYDEIGRVFKSETDYFKTPGLTNDRIHTSKVRYDRNSRVIRSEDARANVWTTDFDGANRPLLSTDPKGNKVTRSYDDNGNVVQTKEEEVEGSSTQTYWTDIRYDAANRPTLSVDNLFNAHRTFYDSRGNVVTTTDANASGTTSITLDRGEGSTSYTINDTGNRIFYTHDGLGRQIEIIRELRSSHNGSNSIDTSNSENSDGLITTQTNFDDNSRVINRDDDKGNTTSYAYDVLNRKTSETFADSTSRSWQYDKDDHITLWTDQRGTTCTINKTNDIDALGRVLKKSYTLSTGVEGTTEQLFEYDGLSRVTQSSDNNGTGTGDDSVVDCEFDSLSNCISEDQALGSSSGTVDSDYDQNSNLVRLTYPNKFGGGTRQIVYGYDSLNRVELVEESAGVLTSGVYLPTSSTSDDIADYTFFGPSRVKQRRYDPSASTPMSTTFTYDNGKRVTNLEHSNLLQPDGTTALTLDFDYAYDREGNVIGEDATHEATGEGLDYYRYDSAYRLVGEGRDVPSPHTLPTNNTANNPTYTGTGGDDRSWTLDGITNWKSFSETIGVGSATTTTRATNSVNEYTSITVGMGSPVSRSHDSNGNLIDNGTYEFKYDALNRLVRTVLKSSSTTIAEHYWDTKNRRVRHDVTDGTNNEDNQFFYKGSSLIEEIDDTTASLVKQYVFGSMGERCQIKDLSNIDYFIEKSCKTVVGIVSNNRILSEYYDYKQHGLCQVLQAVDTLFFNGNDTKLTINLSNSNHYLFSDCRIDFETTLYLLQNFRHFNPFDGRSIQRFGEFGRGLMGLFYWVWLQGQAIQDTGSPTKPSKGPLTLGINIVSNKEYAPTFDNQIKRNLRYTKLLINDRQIVGCPEIELKISSSPGGNWYKHMENRLKAMNKKYKANLKEGPWHFEGPRTRTSQLKFNRTILQASIIKVQKHINLFLVPTVSDYEGSSGLVFGVTSGGAGISLISKNMTTKSFKIQKWKEFEGKWGHILDSDKMLPMDWVLKVTLAHEIGHSLIDRSHKSGTLMGSNPANAAPTLNKDQCKRIRETIGKYNGK